LGADNYIYVSKYLILWVPGPGSVYYNSWSGGTKFPLWKREELGRNGKL